MAMRVDIIGGGIFGCTAAILAAQRGLDTHLYEKKATLMSGASWHNQFRLHRGYHYPRSPMTGEECRTGIDEFVRLYPQCLQRDRDSWYGIVDSGRTTVEDYRNFLHDNSLDYDDSYPSPFSDAVDWAFKPREYLIDPWALRSRIEMLVLRSGVHVHLNTAGDQNWVMEDPVIVALYDETDTDATLRYQLVEKLVVKLGEEHENLSAVILDGDYGSVDPYGHSGLHLVGHVKHAVHATWIGYHPPPWWAHDLVNTGVHRFPPRSKRDQILDDLRYYLPAVRTARYVGSMFTIRCVKAWVDATDERRTDVTLLGDRRVSILSGKIPSCVSAAKEALSLLNL